MNFGSFFANKINNPFFLEFVKWVDPHLSLLLEILAYL